MARRHLCTSLLDVRSGGGLLDGPPFRLGQPPPGGLGLRLSGRFGPAEGSQLLALRLRLGPERGQLGLGFGELSVRLGNGRLQVELPWRDRRRHGPSLDGGLRFRGGALIRQPRPIPSKSLEIRGQPPGPQLQPGQGALRRLVRLLSFTLHGGSRRHLRRERGSPAFGRIEIGHRPIGLGLCAFAVSARLREAGRRLVPARVCRGEERGRELVADARSRRLLLCLGRQSAGLRPQLGQDVVDAREVRLGFRELLLRLAAATLVASDPGDFLEQRPPFLGSQRQRLVDHALADEQERVVGQVRAIEQVDEVAQADALLVEEILVLAAAEQPAAELEDLEVDRQQSIGVVEDQRDVGHALRGTLLRPGPDDVLGLA